MPLLTIFDTKTTSTALYAALPANISCGLACVKFAITKTNVNVNAESTIIDLNKVESKGELIRDAFAELGSSMGSAASANPHMIQMGLCMVKKIMQQSQSARLVRHFEGVRKARLPALTSCSFIGIQSHCSRSTYSIRLNVTRTMGQVKPLTYSRKFISKSAVQ